MQSWLAAHFFEDRMEDHAANIIAAIDSAYRNETPQEPRSYIGASIIGNPCDAMIAFQMRGFPDSQVEPKLKRIFKMGHTIEDIVVRDLKKAGYFVQEIDGLTGKQYAYDAYGGHVVCHTDGQIELDRGEPSILEVKSMNDSSFNKFKKNGVKAAHPRYFAQLQMMMGMSGIQTSLFIAQNKKEYHAELVGFDPFEWGYIEARIGGILSGSAQKLARDPEDWRCRGCFKADACWGDARPKPLCRNCVHSLPREEGGWWCGLKERKADQPCDKHEYFKPKERD
jgi:hypothetical protein